MQQFGGGECNKFTSKYEYNTVWVLYTGSVHSRVEAVALRVDRVRLHVPTSVCEQLLPTRVSGRVNTNHLQIHKENL